MARVVVVFAKQAEPVNPTSIIDGGGILSPTKSPLFLPTSDAPGFRPE